MLVGPAPTAAAGPSPECLAHLEQVGKTEAADQRYWLERGQLPLKCPLRDEASTGEPKHEQPKDSDEKSRYCRKRWYC